MVDTTLALVSKGGGVTPEVHGKRLVEEIIFPGLESPKWTIGKRRHRSGPDKHKIHSIAKQESMHHSEVLITKLKRERGRP